MKSIAEKLVKHNEDDHTTMGKLLLSINPTVLKSIIRGTVAYDYFQDEDTQEAESNGVGDESVALFNFQWLDYLFDDYN
jgi:hypothetical protein